MSLIARVATFLFTALICYGVYYVMVISPAPLLFVVFAVLYCFAILSVHEGGHFIAALLTGRPISSMQIGVGPLVWSRLFGGVWVRVHAIPLFGFVYLCWLSKRPLVNAAVAGAGPSADFVGGAISLLLGFDTLGLLYLGHGLINLIPVKTKDTTSDGYSILKYLREAGILK